MFTLQPATVVNRATLAISLVLLAAPIVAGELTLRASDPASSWPAMTAPDPATQEHIRSAFNTLPLHFEANTGQTDEEVKFLSRTAGYTLFLTPTEAVLTVAANRNPSPQPLSQRERGSTFPSGNVAEGQGEGSVLRLHWLNANPDPKIIGAEPLPGKSSYFIGNDSAKWRADVPHYAKVHYAAVYPGIDLVYYGNQSRIEYDFVVAPGADPNQIRLAIDGAQNIHLDAKGNLVLVTDHGDLLQQAPIIYQEIDGARVAVEGTYVLHANHEVGFEVASYDVERTLIVDPLLQATFLGGSTGSAEARALVIHPTTGDVYVAGFTASSDFPGIAGGADTTFSGGEEAFVARLNATLTSLTQATFLGGTGADSATALAIHPGTGDAYVAGTTQSSDFPGIAGGADTTFVGLSEAFVVRLDSTLTILTQATFLGGTGTDNATAFAIHPVSGDVYVAGGTDSFLFPGIAGGADTIFAGGGEAFVARFNSALTSLIQATFLGGNAAADGVNALAIHAGTGDVYVAGGTNSSDFPGIAGGADTTFAGSQEAFVARLNGALTSLIQATFLGGSSFDLARALEIHPTIGDVYVAGYTSSNDFPGIAGGADTTFGGVYDAFVVRLNSALTSTTQATYLGGSDFDIAYALAIHPVSGDVYVAGDASSSNFPGVAGGADTTFGGANEAFVARLNSALTSLTQATFLGGSALDVARTLAIHPTTGDVDVAGLTESSDFPSIAGGADTTFGGSRTVFIARLTADLADDLVFRNGFEGP